MKPSESPNYSRPELVRGVFCNRTLNLRSIQAVGYDMDYTLIHYRHEAWEQRAYTHLKRKLVEQGWPVEDLRYDPEFVVRGLILDMELGNIVKANRFGYVKQAVHGTRTLPFEELREIYGRTVVDLNLTDRYRFLNTLFSLSEACMFAQLVDRLDEGRLEDALGYEELWRRTHRALDEAHAEGSLKADILADPDSYVELDEETPLALLDQKHAGKKLVLITNSDWAYTVPMMEYAFNRFLPEGMVWRDLFDLIVVSARKPSFFNDPNPAFEVVSEEGLLRPVVGGLEEGKAYVGGHAGMVERLWGLKGDQILYVGDHMYADVAVTKKSLHWRTALVAREMEEELEALTSFEGHQRKLAARMREKEKLEYRQSRVRLAQQRAEGGYGPEEGAGSEELRAEQKRLQQKIRELDDTIAPLAKASNELASRRWGLPMRAGNDKSHLARQLENYADIYLSRVSNLLYATPFAYLRSPRASLPHDAMGAQASLEGME